VRIAGIQIEAGNATQARQTIAEALAAARVTTNANNRAQILADIAGLQGEAGDVVEARQTVFEALAAVNETDDDIWHVLVLIQISSQIPI
jgi:multidrug efflux pump subunit AcrA (membrane-fusion protein)